MGDATKLAFAVFLISCSSGGCGRVGGLCIGFIYNQLCRCLLLPLQSVVKCGGRRMQCNATQLGGRIKGGKSLFSSPSYGFCASSMCVDVHWTCCRWQDGVHVGLLVAHTNAKPAPCRLIATCSIDIYVINRLKSNIAWGWYWKLNL